MKLVEIIKTVAELANVSVEDILGSSRKAELVNARTLCIHALSNNFPDFGEGDIMLIMRMHRTSYYHFVERHQNLLKYDSCGTYSQLYQKYLTK